MEEMLSLFFHDIATKALQLQGYWEDSFRVSGIFWHLFKVTLIVPLLKLLVILLLTFMTMMFVDQLYMAIALVVIKLFKLKPENLYKWEAIKEDLEGGTSAFPMVLVQIPMYNEKEVYQLSIGAACGLSWPADRLIIQVLDDSTDYAIKEMVVVECSKWKRMGINIKHERRGDRKRYKAGLKEGMKHSYVSLCEFVAIFDADFQPNPDFLQRTMPFLAFNPDIALVQSTLKSVLTRMQEMSLDYHFLLEQEVGSATCAFFGFNGTAGVWKISALIEAGGWKDRTTVEDMDLAVRATVKGWKFVYVGDVKVKSELPSTFKAYRNQQHRWSCGTAHLFKKMALEIAKSERLSVWRKFYLIYNFFLVRKILAHLVPLILYCIVLPTTVFFSEVQVPRWGGVYLPCSISLLIVLSSPRSPHLVILWIFFEIVMSLNRIKGTLVGLLGVGQFNKWVVTEKLGDTLTTQKLGDALKTPLLSEVPKKPCIKIGERVHFLELFVGLYLVICTCYDLYFKKLEDYYFILPFPTIYGLLGSWVWLYWNFCPGLLNAQQKHNKVY